MLVLAAIFSLLVAAAGWYYLFYSRAAEGLGAIEDRRTNQLRIRLRRVGGCVMILLGVAFYIGCDALVGHKVVLFAVMMFAVLALMAIVLILGLADLRLTQKIRRHQDELNKKDTLK